MKALYFSAAFAALLLTTGCQKDHSAKEVAGKGGPAALRISLNYNGIPLEQGRVRIRYNASEAPANPLGWSDSADVTQLRSTVGQALFPSLYKGRYYIEGTGYLPNSTFKNPKIVTGGFAYTLTEDRTINLSLPLDIVVE